MTTPLVVHVPGLRLRSVLNGSHRHWGVVAGERRRVRKLVAAALLAHVGRACPLALPLVVTVTRVAPSGGLDEFENLPSACKAVVDETAAWLGLKNDRDARVRWVAAQRRGEWGVEVRIEARVDSAGESARETVAESPREVTLAASPTRPRRTAAARKGRR